MIGLETGSPVWFSIHMEIISEIDMINFDFSFLSGTRGFLTVFFDENVVFEADQIGTIEGINNVEVPIGNIEPGKHTITFRLDSFNDEKSVAEIYNIKLGVTSELLEGDLDQNGCIDRSDYSLIIADIRGPEPHNPVHDLNGDGIVNISDARYLVTLFTNPRGAPCP